MAIESGSLLGGVFIPTFVSGTIVIGTGASGLLFTITPPSGERVKMTAIDNADVAAHTLTIGADTPITSLQLHNDTSNVGWSTGVGSGANGNSANVGNTGPLMGGVDEVITLTRDSGSTSNDTRYSYMFGVLR